MCGVHRGKAWPKEGSGYQRDEAGQAAGKEAAGGQNDGIRGENRKVQLLDNGPVIARGRIGHTKGRTA